MTRNRTLAAIGAAATLALAGCGGGGGDGGGADGGGGDSGGGDAKAACADMERTLNNVTSEGLKQVSDPSALQDTYDKAASEVRASASKAGGDVSHQGEKVASAMESLARSATSGGIPSATELTQAQIELKNACQ